MDLHSCYDDDSKAFLHNWNDNWQHFWRITCINLHKFASFAWIIIEKNDWRLVTHSTPVNCLDSVILQRFNKQTHVINFKKIWMRKKRIVFQSFPFRWSSFRFAITNCTFLFVLVSRHGYLPAIRLINLFPLFVKRVTARHKSRSNDKNNQQNRTSE